MARIRTVKPAHWSDRELPEISLQAHLLWIGTWNFSDDKGIFEADPLLLKSQIFPRRTDIRVEQIKSWLDQLVKARFILPFTYNGVGYYVCRTFEIHQKIDRPQPSQIPQDELVKVFADYSTNVHRTLSPVLYSIVEDSKVGEGGELPPTLTPEEIEFNEVIEWIKEKAPRILKLEQPLTMDQYFTLKTKYGVDAIPKYLQAMHNWKDLTKKRVSAYLTFQQFVKRDNQNELA
jgi:hypothetical protein